MANNLETTFDILTSPVEEFLSKNAAAIDQKARSKKLFFADFVRTLIFGISIQVGSLQKLVTELLTHPSAKALGLPATPFSTLQEAFSRFRAEDFRAMLMFVLANTVFLEIPEIRALGTLLLVDGSLFPVIQSIHWAAYNKRFKAIKLHLAFELNRMLPVEFMVTEGNASERKFLRSILKSGITYVMDRGYVCFKLFAQMADAGAYFVCHVKDNLKYTIKATLTVGADLPKACFGAVSDLIVELTNDDQKRTYRLVIFTMANLEFYILTNRFELTTFQVILIYAYRWQVELIFRFLKHTLHGIHLFNCSPNGAQICFFAFLLTAVLQLKLRQLCATAVHKKDTLNENKEITFKIGNFFQSIGEKLALYWKLSCHWLISLRNALAQRFEWGIVQQLGTS